MLRLLSLMLPALLTLPAPSFLPATAMPDWSWPLPPPRVIVRPYIAPQTTYSAGHRGIDITMAAGSAVFSPADGVVYFAGTVVDRPVLTVRHPGGLLSSYEPVNSTLTEGAVVTRGEPIGVVQEGHCASACLHFGVRLDGQYVSPLKYLGGIPRSVLLPVRR